MSTPLTLQEVAQQQALAEGYVYGPTPTVNNANLNTQAEIGNPLVPVSESTPYFPPTTITPNLGLTLIGLDDTAAQNMVLIDAATSPSSPVLSSTVTLTNSQILAASTEGAAVFPILVPAPGAGLMINLVSVFIHLNDTVAPYSGLTSDGIFEFSLFDGSSLTAFLAQQPTLGFFNTTNPMLALATGTGGGEVVPFTSSQVVNRPLVMAIEDSISGGNAANTMKIICYYTLVTP